MDERHRQFTQYAATALNQFAGANPGGNERSVRERSDGRSSTGSTSSGSSNSSSGGPAAAAAAVAAAASVGGNPALWGELSRALQYNYPGWPPHHQGGPDFHRYGGYGNYNEATTEGRNIMESRTEGRRVPSKGETKVTPPLPPGMGSGMGSTLASLQQLVNLPNEDVYRTILAQQYAAAAALSALPPTSRPSLSPIPPPSTHSSISPNQLNTAPPLVSRQHLDHMSNQQYSHAPDRVRAPLSQSSPLAPSFPGNVSSIPPDISGMNGEYSDNQERIPQANQSPHHIGKDRMLEHRMMQPHPTSQSTPPPPPKSSSISPVERFHPQDVGRDMSCIYEDDKNAHNLNSRMVDGGFRSGSESEGDQRIKHKRKQDQPRRQSVIYSHIPVSQSHTNIPPQSESSSDDSQGYDVHLSRPPTVNHSDIPHNDSLHTGPPNLECESENNRASMSQAMSHALAHPFLAAHLNPLDSTPPIEKRENKSESPSSTCNSTSMHIGDVPQKRIYVKDHRELCEPSDSPPSTTQSSHSYFDNSSCSGNYLNIQRPVNCLETGDVNQFSEPNLNIRTSQPNFVNFDCSAPVKKRKVSQNCHEFSESKSELSANEYQNEVSLPLLQGSIVSACESVGHDKLPDNVQKLPENIVNGNVFDNRESISNNCKTDSPNENCLSEEISSDRMNEDFFNENHTTSNKLLPSKVNDNRSVNLEEHLESSSNENEHRRRTRQKRPVSYVEDETDPVLETNEDFTPVLSPLKKKGRRSKDKTDSDVGHIEYSNNPVDVETHSELNFRDKPFPNNLESCNEMSNYGKDNIPSNIREPLHIDTNAVYNLGPPTISPNLHSPDIYDFNDTDTDPSSRSKRGRRGRKRSSPRRSAGNAPEVFRSHLSPHSREQRSCSKSPRSPKFFTNAKSAELVEKHPDNQADLLENVVNKEIPLNPLQSQGDSRFSSITNKLKDTCHATAESTLKESSDNSSKADYGNKFQDEVETNLSTLPQEHNALPSTNTQDNNPDSEIKNPSIFVQKPSIEKKSDPPLDTVSETVKLNTAKSTPTEYLAQDNDNMELNKENSPNGIPVDGPMEIQASEKSKIEEFDLNNKLELSKKQSPKKRKGRGRKSKVSNKLISNSNNGYKSILDQSFNDDSFKDSIDLKSLDNVVDKIVSTQQSVHMVSVSKVNTSHKRGRVNRGSKRGRGSCRAISDNTLIPPLSGDVSGTSEPRPISEKSEDGKSESVRSQLRNVRVSSRIQSPSDTLELKVETDVETNPLSLENGPTGGAVPNFVSVSQLGMSHRSTPDIATENDPLASNDETEAETVENIAKFLEATAPSIPELPKSPAQMSTCTEELSTPNTSSILSDSATPSTGELSYRESRPKRVSRPPPEMNDGEMNDLLLLLNMEDEESEDEDYIPKKDAEDAYDSNGESEADGLSFDEGENELTEELPKQKEIRGGSSKDEASNKQKKLDKGKDKKKKLQKGKRIEEDEKKKDDGKRKVEDKIDKKGPLIRFDSGNKDYEVIVNVPDRDEDDKEKNSRKLSIPFNVDIETIHKNTVKVGFNSTLHNNYDAFNKDMSWFCAFCKNYSHYRTLGDLFGPIYVKGVVVTKKTFPDIIEGQILEASGSPMATSSMDNQVLVPKLKSKRTPRHDSFDQSDAKKFEIGGLSPPSRFVPSATPARMLGRGLNVPCSSDGTSRLASPRMLPSSPLRHDSVKNSSNSILQNKKPEQIARSNSSKDSTSGVSNPPGTECWLHEACIVWASGISVVNSKLIGIEEALLAAQESVCSHCGETGATVCCLGRGCSLVVHVPCARLLLWTLNVKSFQSHCPKHFVSSGCGSKEKKTHRS